MVAYVSLYSKKQGEINKFLSKFYNSNLEIQENTSWKKEYDNPIEIAEIVGTYIDNIDDYQINMWLCLDEGLLVKITLQNADEIIKYLYERFPY